MGFDIPCPAFVCEGIGDNSISKGFNYREDITYTVAFIAGGGFGCDPINTSFLRDVCLQRSLHAHDAAALRCDEGGDETSDENARKFRASCNTTTSSMITMLRTGL